MASDNVKVAAKNGLPFLIAAFVCGYATDAIPHFLPNGEFRDWAYRMVPVLSMIILFIIRTLSDFGGMSFTGIMFTICANPEKKRLKRIMYDQSASEDTKKQAGKRYDEILVQEMELGSRWLKYISCWSAFRSPPTPPQSTD